MSRPRQTTDEQILDAARACFDQHGVQVPTEVIAGKAGVSQAVLFQRFKTRDRLLRAALSPPERIAWLEAVEQGPSDGDVRAQLLSLGRLIHDDFQRMVPRISALRSAGVPPHEFLHQKGGDPAPLRARKTMARWFARAAARELIARCNPEHVADLFLGALWTRCFYRHISGQRVSPSGDRAYVQTVVDFLWKSLAPSS